MPVEIPAGHVLLTWEFKLGNVGDPAMCTMGAAPDNPVAPGTASQVYDAWMNSVLQQQDSTWFLTRATISDPGGVVEEEDRSTAGGAVGQGSPPQVSYVVKKLTGISGKKNRGRFYIPGVSEDSVGDDGVVLPGQVNELQSLLNGLYTELQLLDLQPVIFHSDSSPPTVIASFKCTSVVGTQRRRLHR